MRTYNKSDGANRSMVSLMILANAIILKQGMSDEAGYTGLFVSIPLLIVTLIDLYRAKQNRGGY